MFKPVMGNDEVQSKTFTQKVMKNLDVHLRISTAHIFICLLCYKMASICLEYYSCQGKKDEKRNLIIQRTII